MSYRKTILLTGATGFLGSELLKRFISMDYNIKTLVRSSKEIDPNEKISKILTNAGINTNTVNSQYKNLQVIEGEITDRNLGLKSHVFEELKNNVDEVFHCAAAIKFSGLSREDLIKTNYIGTKNILNFCVAGRKKHLNYISTAYVAGKKQNIVYENELDNSSGFHNYYEESKFLAEEAIHNYASFHKLHYTIYRPSIIIGDSITNYTMNFDGIYTFARSMLLIKRKFESIAGRCVQGLNQPLKRVGVIKSNGSLHIPVRIPANPEATINLVPIDYVTSAILSIFLDKNRVDKAFHIVNPYPPKLEFIFESICEILSITGVEIVEPDNCNAKEFTSLEKKTWKKINVYALYMCGEPYFQSKNTQSILSDFCIKCPRITKDFIAELIKYAIDNNWGNNDNSNNSTYFDVDQQKYG